MFLINNFLKMRNIKFNPFKYFLLIILCITLNSCGGGINAGLEAYQSPDGRYAFLYPTGWTRVKVEGGPEIIYHDLINSNETLSLVVSDVNNEVDLEQLGTPLEVGQTLIDKVIAPTGSGRSVKLVDANVVIDRGTLYTFAVGTNEERWNKVYGMFNNVIESFNFLI